MECLLLRNVWIYDTERTDILTAGGKIIAIGESLCAGGIPCREIDCKGRRVIPGLVDSHVHFLGAAGDEGYNSKTPEIFLSHFLVSGVTTAVGVLGFGCSVEGLRHLYAKAHTLEEDGISTYIFTGSFSIPSPTITGSVKEDLVLLPRVLGVKTSIADQCSSHPTVLDFARLAAEAYTGGLQSGKPGLLHTHVGHHTDPYEFLNEVRKFSGIPSKQFIPTHCNWSAALAAGAEKYALAGGYVDFSTILANERGSITSIKPADAVMQLLEGGVDADAISLSSDGNVGMPLRDENGKQYGLYLQRVHSLYEEVCSLVKAGMTLETAVGFASKNPAKRLGLYPRKGAIQPGADADMIILNDDLSIDTVIAKGKVALEHGRPVMFSLFERELETKI